MDQGMSGIIQHSQTMFYQEPELLMPDHSKPFQIESDALKVATGAVLTQTDLNGDRHPVAFLSQTFTDMEQ